MEEVKNASWIVYNHGDRLEFAECSICKFEEPPAIYGERHMYTKKCPNCRAVMLDVITAEEIDGEGKGVF